MKFDLPLANTHKKNLLKDRENFPKISSHSDLEQNTTIIVQILCCFSPTERAEVYAQISDLVSIIL